MSEEDKKKMLEAFELNASIGLLLNLSSAEAEKMRL
jgi:hypothetical protein